MPLPFLNLMHSNARAAETEQRPLRFLTLFKPNGVHPPSWNISGGSETDFRLSPLMKPFEKHKQDVLILDNMGDFGFSSHANSTRRFLSGRHDSTKAASVDQVIAHHIQGDTPHRSLELTTEGLFPNQIGCSYISYDSRGSAIPRESDPQLIFDRLFRNPMASEQMRRRMTSVLDRVQDDARSLARQAGQEDRETLDEYLTIVRESERRLQNMKQSRSHVDVSGFQRPPVGGDLNDQVESMLDLIELALWTDSTRCITYMLGNSNSRMIFDFLGIKEQHHYLSHFFRNFSRSNLEALLKISVWHMEKFDSLMTRLKSRRDGNGRLLDNTVVLFGSGMGHSDNHTATRIPIVLAGGQNVLKTGRYVRYAQNQQLGKLHLSLLQMFGIEASSFGGSDAALDGLNDSGFEPYQEREFESWVRTEGPEIIVQGRLRMSDDLDEARIFFIDVAGRKPVKIDVPFKDFHEFNLAYHCGTGITVRGTGSVTDDVCTINRIVDLNSVFGNAPGSARG